ncbi:MAG: hydrolase [Bacteroidetes bacterium]|nr:hydrolase [Bacteroidota bacterium]
MNFVFSFDQFIEQLRKRLQQTLPGEDRQFLMAPLHRERMRDLPMQTLEPRKSAVLILLFPHENTVRTVLIERPVYDGVHSGQMAFPGGKFEPEDVDLVNTALRETFEEIGVMSDEVTVIGRLTDLYINPSNFLVSPYVGYMKRVPEFIPNPREVNKVITIDLDLLNDMSIRGTKTIAYSGGLKLKTPYYEVEGLTVWGATAMIISELNAVVEEAKLIS